MTLSQVTSWAAIFNVELASESTFVLSYRTEAISHSAITTRRRDEPFCITGTGKNLSDYYT